ncbi:MAG: hypothetical protein L6R40_005796 [Gallowayella cf. fulva]|nr:MAG: hypothetical protein L6R40_005796 [Xanthomendoza cf. fulva]
MPPARRGRPPGSTSSAPSNGNPRAAQQTLAFGRKNNKITKPSLPPPSSRKISKVKDDGEPTTPTAAAEVASVEDVKVEDGKVEVVDEDPALAYGRERGMAIREAKQDEQTSKQDPMEEKAKAVSEAAVKRYWREREAERKAPRVHQKELSLHEKILRHFDLSSQYGPCVGIPRMRRWKRAEGLGLKPPIEVLAVLVREEKGMERAFMDGLLGGSAVVG